MIGVDVVELGMGKWNVRMCAGVLCCGKLLFGAMEG